jgi:hypothetical protein
MTDLNRDHWTAARTRVVARWRQVVERIGARDEGGTLSLTNEMDEFCDEAATVRRDLTAAGAGVAPATGDGRLQGANVMRCQFCIGFTRYGGCFGILQNINHAVLGGDWEKACTLAVGYIDKLEAMDFSSI